ncbi:MAG: NAD(+) synthase, partial [Rothia mucilaginosa]
RQNQLLLRVLGASERLWAKPPTADLLDGVPGRTDEDELGLTYPQIDDYLEGKEIEAAAAAKLEQIYLRSRHKRTTPVTIFDSWWKN